MTRMVRCPPTSLGARKMVEFQASILSRLMDEPIRMPGFPQIIVRRGWAYQWLKNLGWKESERGFGSLDYQVFSKERATDPLTPDEKRDHFMNQLAEDYRRA